MYDFPARTGAGSLGMLMNEEYTSAFPTDLQQSGTPDTSIGKRQLETLVFPRRTAIFTSFPPPTSGRELHDCAPGNTRHAQHEPYENAASS